MTVQPQAQADRDACDRLLKAIFDRGFGQRQIARVTGIPLSTVQRALQRVIYPYRRDRPIEDAPTWKKRRAKLESLAIDQLEPTRGSTAATQGQEPKSRIAPRNDVRKNDLRECEAMLYSQAHALQAIFVDAARQVKKQGWFSTSEAYTRIALKAQNQCRATLETLAQIKNPPVVFARQANIAQGPQQVNNAMMPAGEPRAGAGKTEKPQNKLSGGSNELLPDIRTPGAAVGSDPAMATLETFDRAEVRRG